MKLRLMNENRVSMMLETIKCLYFSTIRRNELRCACWEKKDEEDWIRTLNQDFATANSFILFAEV